MAGIMKLFIDLTPLIPLSFQERGRNKKRGVLPPLKSLLLR
jgi:hypothetical protein